MPRASSYLANTSTNAHRAWVDAVSCLPLPAVVVAACAAGGGDAPAHRVLFANGACINFTGRDQPALRGEPLASLLAHPEKDAAALLCSLATGCMFVSRDVDLCTHASERSSIVAYPVTEMCDGAPLIAHLLVFLPGGTAQALAGTFLTRCTDSGALKAADWKLHALADRAHVRVGLFAASGACDGMLPSTAAEAHQQALCAVFQSALASRAAGRLPVSALPGVVEVQQWLEHFERCMTSMPAP